MIARESSYPLTGQKFETCVTNLTFQVSFANFPLGNINDIIDIPILNGWNETRGTVEKIFNNISINGEKVYLEPDRSDLSKFH